MSRKIRFNVELELREGSPLEDPAHPDSEVVRWYFNTANNLKDINDNVQAVQSCASNDQLVFLTDTPLEAESGLTLLDRIKNHTWRWWWMLRYN
jgi:hypothetical protein